MVVVLLFPSFRGCAFLRRRRRRRRRHQNRVRSEDDEESARRTNGFSLPHEEWVPGDGMKRDSAFRTFSKEKKRRRFYASRAFLFWVQKILRTNKRLDFFTLSKVPRAKKKKENAPESDRASCCFIKTEWEKLPGDTTTRSFFFFFINGFRARGELNSWNLLSPRDVEEKKTTREDGSTTSNSRAGKERR